MRHKRRCCVLQHLQHPVAPRTPLLALPRFLPHSAQKQERAAAAVTAGVISGVGAMMASPLMAEAAVTPSLK